MEADELEMKLAAACDTVQRAYERANEAVEIAYDAVRLTEAAYNAWVAYRATAPSAVARNVNASVGRWEPPPMGGRRWKAMLRIMRQADLSFDQALAMAHTFTRKSNKDPNLPTVEDVRAMLTWVERCVPSLQLKYLEGFTIEQLRSRL